MIELVTLPVATVMPGIVPHGEKILQRMDLIKNLNPLVAEHTKAMDHGQNNLVRMV